MVLVSPEKERDEGRGREKEGEVGEKKERRISAVVSTFHFFFSSLLVLFCGNSSGAMAVDPLLFCPLKDQLPEVIRAFPCFLLLL